MTLDQIVLWADFVLKNKTEWQFLKIVDSKLIFFGLPCVIEQLNYDQWSGQDTLNDQKIHWKAIFYSGPCGLLRELFCHVCYVPTEGHN